MRPLIFATRNRGKVVELRALLPGYNVLTVVEAEAQFGLTIPDVVEDADTFFGNARKKACEVARLTQCPALADDSGLCVHALGGAPGVFSARYAGEKANDAANNAKLLAALEAWPQAAQRTAHFHCTLVLADPAGPLGSAVLTAEGESHGEILTAPRGQGGFGYDPLFWVPQAQYTFAELPLAAKGDRSHRGRAMRAIAPMLDWYLGNRPDVPPAAGAL